MGWKEAQSQYQKKKTLADQSVEDLVARRVLRGLGLVQRDVTQLEYSLYAQMYGDEPLWVRTQRILQSVFQFHGKLALYRSWHIQVVESKKDGKDVIERFESVGEAVTVQPVLMTRVKGTKQSLTYTWWEPGDIGLTLRPPFNVIAAPEYSSRYVAVQETEHFIAQFGPYDLEKLHR